MSLYFTFLHSYIRGFCFSAVPSPLAFQRLCSSNASTGISSQIFKCSVIIDCTEIFIERARNLTVRALTWSNYKHHNTIKILVGMAPTGAISFLSKVFYHNETKQCHSLHCHMQSFFRIQADYRDKKVFQIIALIKFICILISRCIIKLNSSFPVRISGKTWDDCDRKKFSLCLIPA